MVFLIIAVPDVENCCERKVNILANLRKSYLKDFIFSKVTTIKSVILPKMNLLRDFFFCMGFRLRTFTSRGTAAEGGGTFL